MNQRYQGALKPGISFRIVNLMKRLSYLLTAALLLCPVAVFGGDREVFLNAFGETAKAYLSDAQLLLGTTADGFVAGHISQDTAKGIAENVQTRVRIIRSRLKAVADCRIAEVDKRLIDLFDKAYACMDHQAWAFLQYVQEKTPETSRRFNEQRTGCLPTFRKIDEFYSTLPPAPELPEPLSTR